MQFVIVEKSAKLSVYWSTFQPSPMEVWTRTERIRYWIQVASLI